MPSVTSGKARWYSRAAKPLRKPETWNDTSYHDRADDIRGLIDAIRADERFRTCVDWSRLGLAGHSLGGYTVLGLCGAWPSWKLTGVKAVLALSPYSQPFILHKTLADLSVPVMYQGGTWDYGATPRIDKSGLSYEQSPAPKYYVEFKKAGHLAWTNIGKNIIAQGNYRVQPCLHESLCKRRAGRAPADASLSRCRAVQLCDREKKDNQDKAGKH